MEKRQMERCLDIAQDYADKYSTCCKVKVGSLIETKAKESILGCNHGVHNCKQNGCRRIGLYGEASKKHRLPSDCDSIHSEIDAICSAARRGMNLLGATIFVTRYPCEACARAIANSGIETVVYGRRENISDYTRIILDEAGVDVIKADWEGEDNNE